jgi:4-hydroxybenzoate polyprenyltransferase
VHKTVALLRLMRPANIITAVSDILAGIAISGYFSGAYSLYPILLLVIATVGLYGGGVVFNDVFDADLDSIERPERPIPSGIVAKNEAAILGAVLLFAAIVAAAFVHPGFFTIPALLAIATAAASLIYDRWGKHHALLGPLNMGLCRGLNLLLGVSIVPAAVPQLWYLGFVPIIYIAAITMISRGEVHGGKRSTLYGAVLLYATVTGAILSIAILHGTWLLALLCLVLFLAMILPPLFWAIQQPVGPRIGKAVKAGVIGLILMNASWAAAFGFPYIALIIILLLPLSLLLAKLFAVT